MKLFIIFKKELVDQIRDKRTMIASVFLPAVIVPLLLLLMTQAASNDAPRAPIRIVLREAAPRLEGKILESFAEARFLYAPSSDASILSGKAELGIDVHESDGRYSDIALHYDPARRASALAYVKIRDLLTALLGKPPAATDAVGITALAVRNAEASKTLLTLSVLLPVFLILFAASSAMSSVIDLSAGEKERGTIETLISCNISRSEIVMGKTLAAACIGFTAVASLLAGLIIGSQFFPEITGGMSMVAFLGFGNTALLLLVALLCVLPFAAAGMAIGLYAKSVKEGTILTLPVIILSSALSSGFVGGDPFSIGILYDFVPILNFACVIRSLLFDHMDWGAFLISVLANFAYTVSLLYLGNRLLKKETVICRS